MDPELQQLLRELQQESSQAYTTLKPLIDAIRDNPEDRALAELLRRLILDYLAAYHPALRLLMIRIFQHLSKVIGYDLVGPLIGYEGIVVAEGAAAAGSTTTGGAAASGTGAAAGTATTGAGAGTGAAAGTGTSAGASATAGTTTAGTTSAAPTAAAGGAGTTIGSLLIAGAGALAQALILFGAGVALPASKLGDLSIQVKSPCDERYEEILAAFAAYQQMRGDYPINATRGITTTLLGKASSLVDRCDACLKACPDHNGARAVRRFLRPLLEDHVADYLSRL